MKILEPDYNHCDWLEISNLSYNSKISKIGDLLL